MSNLSQITRQELLSRKAALIGEQAGADAATRARLEKEIVAIETEIDNRALGAGKEAGEKVGRLDDDLKEIENKEPLDALSALGRTAKRIEDAGGGGQNGNG